MMTWRRFDSYGEWVYFKISPIKGVKRFRKKGKLSSLYLEPYKILKRVVEVQYELDLSTKLASVHPVFHMTMLKKSIRDTMSILPTQGLGVKRIILINLG